MIPSRSRVPEPKSWSRRRLRKLGQEEEVASPEQHAGGASEYIKSIVFGGLDGIITTFAVIASATGAGKSIEVILLLGWASLLADALSMGLGDYISEKAEGEYVSSEQKRERREVELHMEGEKEEMREIYRKRGMPEADCVELIEIFSRYPEAFVDLMMVVELEMMPPEEAPEYWKFGLVTFCSFCMCGCVPLIVYVIYYVAKWEQTVELFWISAILAGVVIFGLGVVKGVYSNVPWYRSGFEMLLVGILANLIAYFVAYGLNTAFKVPSSLA
eukprot:gb/GEZN01015069.1/.p1 GENE.gb/GEZN01015069.1/~~gb/GEZN01015069.1/.p1  ORF type:complete len:273 (+),score=41.33 gb/GEZN01015069.1/:28-846(+)